jgi:maltose O-acetyltransferase
MVKRNMRIPIKKVRNEFKDFFREFLINGIAASNLTPKIIRLAMYKLYGMKLQTFGIRGGCFFGSARISIGKGTFVNCNCFFDGTSDINIGDNCAIAMNVTFCNSNHDYEDPLKRGGEVLCKPITIGNGVWIGANSTILPGVTIGDGCVIAAGAVVTKDCKPNGLYLGVPARRKELEA